MQFPAKKYLTALIHFTIWVGIFFYPFLFHYIPVTDIRAVFRIAIFLVLLASFFYFNSFFLIPKVLGKKMVLLYLAAVALAIIAIAFGAGYIQVLLNPLYGSRKDLFSSSAITGVIAGILTLFISSGIKVTSEWFKNQQLMKSIENEKLNSELNFLRSQVNPHFLFNALNNIYALENKKSPETGSAIIKLSELVRYMLYETGTEFVPLQKEIDYLTNYIALQKLSLRSDVTVEFNIQGDFTGKKIEPMLLIPLVENVFKHGISYKNNVPLKINLSVSGNDLELVTSNFLPTGANEHQFRGIGLANLEKRLRLLYGDSHTLSVSRENGLFTAQLKLRLK